MRSLVLASSSPRRMEILANLNLGFEVIPSQVEELIQGDTIETIVCNLAELKAAEVSKMVGNECIIIGADTIVYKDGKIFGKPASDEEAITFLKQLSGSSHSVITGLCIIDNISGRTLRGFEETIVFFKNLSDKEIIDYIKTGEHKDKAGAYGIQGVGGVFVEKIHGCYFNVVGLPVNRLYKMMGDLGVNLIEKGEGNGK